ncbi:hypothetical protein OIU77_014003 [Salix suchowensis]|uniref:Legume lectin domain-containing protein n=1 Tax=Salix suchowensis TaxID=1278906 RepID=A0ABQ8ZVW7_9ROSI|nr:hypothetical protein OIU77_014003 [Salix suchowensis]
MRMFSIGDMGAGIPIYKDYIVNFSSYGEGVKYLSIALGSTNGSSAKYGGPFLNGLEIFKLSDFSNNLAGPHPFGVIAAPHSHFSVRHDAESHVIVTVARVATGLLLAYLAIGVLGYGVGGQEVMSRVQKEANGTMNGDLRIMIDNHRCSGYDISNSKPRGGVF